MNDPLCHYVAVREDLPLGLLCAQVVHAAGESSPGDIPPGTHAVVLGCTEDELYSLARYLARTGVPHALIHEDDEPYRGQLLAIGLRPARKSELRPHVKKLRLLGKKSERPASSPDVVSNGRGGEERLRERKGHRLILPNHAKDHGHAEDHQPKDQTDCVHEEKHLPSVKEGGASGPA